jgi:hypothetical protein
MGGVGRDCVEYLPLDRHGDRTRMDRKQSCGPIGFPAERPADREERHDST